jgi:hypothetical protein
MNRAARFLSVVLVAAATLTAAGCTGTPAPAPTTTEPTFDASGIAEGLGKALTKAAFVAMAHQTVEALAANDTARLLEVVDADHGVTFSPYAHIEEGALTFAPDQLEALFTGSDVSTWGPYSGSGNPIQLTWADYKAQFVLDKDYLNAPETGYNEVKNAGNSANNITEVFGEDALFVEFAYGPSQETNLDWGSLRVVFGANDRVVAVVHDIWTI